MAEVFDFPIPPGPAGHWADQAACKGMDPEMCFPGRGVSNQPAKQVCQGCPVRVECLDYAFEGPERFGIWGGLSELERQRIRGARRRARRAIEVAEGSASWG